MADKTARKFAKILATLSPEIIRAELAGDRIDGWVAKWVDHRVCAGPKKRGYSTDYEQALGLFEWLCSEAGGTLVSTDAGWLCRVGDGGEVVDKDIRLAVCKAALMETYDLELQFPDALIPVPGD